MRLENKVALMCGVGPAKGRASALLFAQEGARRVRLDSGPRLTERHRTNGGFVAHRR